MESNINKSTGNNQPTKTAENDALTRPKGHGISEGQSMSNLSNHSNLYILAQPINIEVI